MSTRRKPAPSAAIAPPPWATDTVALPYEVEPAPPGEVCRKCRSAGQRAQLDLARAKEVVASLQELLDRVSSESRKNLRKRRVAERNASGLRALLVEFRQIAEANEKTIESGRKAFVKAKRLRRSTNSMLDRERTRSAQLQAEIQRLRTLISSRPSQRELNDALVEDLQAALRKERERSDRYYEYSRDLERRLQESDGEPTMVAVEAGRSEAARSPDS